MKLSKTVVRIAAFLMLAAMSFGLVGCVTSYNGNPMVAKVGKVKLDLNQYINLYNNSTYSQYLSYGIMTREQYANYILDQLVMQGVQIDQLDVQNITLTAEEEAKVKADAEEQIKEYVKENYLNTVDSSITDENARYEEAVNMFKAELKKNGSTYEAYCKSVEENLTQSERLSKLYDETVKDVTVTDDEVKSYISDSVKTSTTASDFYTSWSNMLSGSSETAPLFMPHPERAVEDDPETADKDESKEADPYGEFFSVKHLLIKFSTEAGESVTDLEEYAAEDKPFNVEIENLEAEFASMTAEDFLAKCADKEICDDPGMQKEAYKYFGYLMQASLLDKYYSGFGYAAMKLMFGDEWKSENELKAEEQATDTAQDGLKPGENEYNVTMFDLADGTKIAKVLTTSGAHYIIINTNDVFCMYDDEGYFMLPLYSGDELTTDGDGIVTVNGHMTQEQFDASNEALGHIEVEHDDEEEADHVHEPMSLKSNYQAYYDTKLNSLKTAAYNTKASEWKENTKIVYKRNVLKAFYQG